MELFAISGNNSSSSKSRNIIITVLYIITCPKARIIVSVLKTKSMNNLALVSNYKTHKPDKTQKHQDKYQVLLPVSPRTAHIKHKSTLLPESAAASHRQPANYTYQHHHHKKLSSVCPQGKGNLAQKNFNEATHNMRKEKRQLHDKTSYILHTQSQQLLHLSKAAHSKEPNSDGSIQLNNYPRGKAKEKSLIKISSLLNPPSNNQNVKHAKQISEPATFDYVAVQQAQPAFDRNLKTESEETDYTREKPNLRCLGLQRIQTPNQQNELLFPQCTSFFSPTLVKYNDSKTNALSVPEKYVQNGFNYELIKNSNYQAQSTDHQKPNHHCQHQPLGNLFGSSGQRNAKVNAPAMFAGGCSSLLSLSLPGSGPTSASIPVRTAAATKPNTGIFPNQVALSKLSLSPNSGQIYGDEVSIVRNTAPPEQGIISASATNSAKALNISTNFQLQHHHHHKYTESASTRSKQPLLRHRTLSLPSFAVSANVPVTVAPSPLPSHISDSSTSNPPNLMATIVPPPAATPKVLGSGGLAQESSPLSRKFQCQHCGKRYMTAAHLARHVTIHLGTKPYVCPFPECGLRFLRSDNCMQHYKTHNNPKGKTTKRMNRLKGGT